MALNRPQIIRNSQAYLELQSALSFNRSLPEVKYDDALKGHAVMALQMIKRIIKTWELQRVFLSQLFPGWGTVKTDA